MTAEDFVRRIRDNDLPLWDDVVIAFESLLVERDALATQIAAAKGWLLGREYADDWDDIREILNGIAAALSADPVAILRERDARVWDEGRIAGGGKQPGHWENDHPRKGMRTWIDDGNPYQKDDDD